MSTDAVSSYLSTYNSSSANKATSTTSTSNNTLDMNDFIQLLVAQLQNQDMYNTTDTTQFMSQMAQYSMVEALNEMKTQSEAASSFSMIGKGVTVSTTDSNGNTVTDSGVVDGVTLTNGTAKVVVNGNSYAVSDVKEVFDASLLTSSSTSSK